MHVTGHDVIDEARLQGPGHLHNLAVHPARRRIERIIELGAAAARMRHDDDKRRAGQAQRLHGHKRQPQRGGDCGGHGAGHLDGHQDEQNRIRCTLHPRTLTWLKARRHVAGAKRQQPSADQDDQQHDQLEHDAV